MEAEAIQHVQAEIDRAANVIEAIRLYARPEILKDYTRESCIGGTRIVFDVLRHYKLKPRAIPVYVRIFNAALLKHVRNGEVPTTEDVQGWSGLDGSWSVGIGGTGVVKPGHWDGHLVALAMGTVLVDVSLDQATRPRFNIHMEPITAAVPENFVAGDPLVLDVNGCAVRYEAHPEDMSWTQAAGWRREEPRKAVVERVIAKVESHLSGV